MFFKSLTFRNLDEKTRSIDAESAPDRRPVRSSAILAAFIYAALLILIPLTAEGGILEDRARDYLRNVIIPFNKLYDEGNISEALHQYQEQYFKVITHYVLAGDVPPLIDRDLMKKTDNRVKSAIKACAPKEDAALLMERLAERDSPAQAGVPSICRTEEYPTMKLRSSMRGSYRAPYNRLSLDGQFLLFEEDFGDWGEMDSQGISVMTLKGRYINRMIERTYGVHQQFLWKPAGGIAAILANMDGAIEFCSVADREKRYCPLESTDNIKMYDWSSDGKSLLFGYLEIDRDYMQESSPMISTRTGLFMLDCNALAAQSIGTGTSARFSSDGTFIVTVDGSFKEYGNVLEGNIVVMDRYQKSRIAVASGSEPQFSPDGSSLVFLRHRDSTTEVIIYDLQSKKEYLISSQAMPVINPAWLSRDEIVYNSHIISTDGMSCTSDIYWHNISTGENIKLTCGGNYLLDPHWLHTGKEIACINKKLKLSRKRQK